VDLEIGIINGLNRFANNLNASQPVTLENISQSEIQSPPESPPQPPPSPPRPLSEECTLAPHPEGIQVNHSDDFIDYDYYLTSSSSESESECSDSEAFLDEHITPVHSISDFLATWAIQFNVSNACLSSLLKYLGKHNCYSELPKDARTLLKTPTATSLRTVSPGQYFHNGLYKGILQTLKQLQTVPQTIELQFNIDGLPVYKSSNTQFWSILGYIRGSGVSPFVVGTYYGPSKPDNANNYLSEFLDEMKCIKYSGIKYNDKILLVAKIILICDAPAKSYILGVKGHTGYYGCVKCSVKGQYINNRVCFADISCSERNYEYSDDLPDDTNILTRSNLADLEINFVSDVPLDYMHLICLGVTKKLLLIWLRGPLSTFRVCSRDVDICDAQLSMIKSSITNDFCRKPRSLREVDRWKATEFRQFLLYTGPVVLKALLPTEHYNLFMSLSVACRILASTSYYMQRNEYADKLLKYFVRRFAELYGAHNISYNVHNLVHLSKDCFVHGTLDSFSAFRFENKLGQMKRVLRSSSKPLQQLHRRLSEQDELIKNSSVSRLIFRGPHLKGPLKVFKVLNTRKQYRSVRAQDTEYTNYSPNNICILRDNRIMKIENILKSGNGFSLIGRILSKCDPFFLSPCQPAIIDIFTVTTVSEPLVECVCEDIRAKCVMIPTNKNNHVVFPVLHSLSE